MFLPACVLLVGLAAAVDGRTTGRPFVQNGVLLVFSLLFYLYGSGALIALLLGVVAVTYAGGLVLHHTPWRRSALGLGVGLLVATLGYFKYAGFFLDQASGVSEWAGHGAFTWTAVALPVGISFFTFQAISYLVDVARREQEPLANPLDVALFISMFPQLIAGPIVRYGDVAAQLRSRRITGSDLALGAVRFTWGLLKKLLLADSVAPIADAAFAVPTPELHGGIAWLGALAYAVQIYFDFSAYSDMAIGLGRMFGFTFPENFARPYSAESITDFWRRWHQTLSFWFRDYVYIPLGGSRSGPWRTYAHLWTVFLLSGLWHGAAWTFVVWGAFHGTLLSLERLARRRSVPRAPLPVRRAVTFLWVVVGFTVFRAESLPHAGAVLRHMALPAGGPLGYDTTLPIGILDALTHRNVAMLLVGVATVALPATFTVGRYLTAPTPTPVRTLARLGVATGGAAVASGILATAHFSPFIYFRF